MSEQTQNLEWNEIYEIGDETVDAQHRRLFEVVNEFLESCNDKSEPQKLKDALSFLVNYTVQHFNDEEALQQKCGYPYYEQHKQIHENFKGTVGGLVQRFWESHSTEELKDNINKVVVRWILNHVQRDDRKIGEYLKETASKS